MKKIPWNRKGKQWPICKEKTSTYVWVEIPKLSTDQNPNSTEEDIKSSVLRRVGHAYIKDVANVISWWMVTKNNKCFKTKYDKISTYHVGKSQITELNDNTLDCLLCSKRYFGKQSLHNQFPISHWQSMCIDFLQPFCLHQNCG